MLVLLLGALICSAIGRLIPDVGECGYPRKVYNLNPGDMMKVQSPQFPKTLTSPQSLANVSCSMTFTRTDGNNYGIQFIFTNGYTAGFLFSTPNGPIDVEGFKWKSGSKTISTINLYDSNDGIKFVCAKNQKSLTFSHGSGSGGLEWSAFEAFVYIPERKEQTKNCWMDKKIFNLTDQTKTIPLFSKQDLTNPQSCSWVVDIPHHMGIKITIPKFSLPNLDAQIRIAADGQEYLDLGEGMSKIYYGKNFVLMMYIFDNSESKRNNATVDAPKFDDNFDGFYALVSVVSNPPPKEKNFQCTKIKNDDNSYTLGFFDPQNGYPNSGICRLPLSLAPRSLLIFQPQKMYTEYLGEWLQVTSAVSLFIGDIFDDNMYSGENVDSWSFRFVTDETVNGAGFKVREFHIDCSCASSEFSLSCTDRQLMPIMPSDLSSSTKTYTYCRGMSCSYKFIPNYDCINNHVQIGIDWQMPGTPFKDNVTLLVDGIKFWDNKKENFFKGVFDQTRNIQILLDSEKIESEVFTQIPTLMVAVSAADPSASTMTPPAIVPTTSMMNCVDGSTYSMDQTECYLVLQSNKTFHEAEADCKSNGGQLTSIHNAFDNIGIYEYARYVLGPADKLFIGANDLTKPGVWEWIDGTPLNFEDFSHSSIPDSHHCVVMVTRNGMWEHYDCNIGTNYACAIRNTNNQRK